jgi:hypothetical protein
METCIANKYISFFNISHLTSLKVVGQKPTPFLMRDKKK